MSLSEENSPVVGEAEAASVSDAGAASDAGSPEPVRESEDGEAEDSSPDGGAAIGARLAGASAVEGAGVILDRPLPMGGVGRRSVPPLPREDPCPEPVSRRGDARRDADGRFRRSPSLDEALTELSRPLEEPSVAEAAAARLRAGRSRNSGTAMRLPAVDGSGRQAFTPQQRLLLLDTWTRSGLPAGDFGTLVGVARQTLYMWKRRFEESGPAGLEDHPRGGPSGSRIFSPWC